MIGKMLKYSSVSVLVCLTMLSGCGNRQSYNKKHYILNAARLGESRRAVADFILEVRRFTIDSAFGGKGLVYRTGEFEYESGF